MDDNDTMKWSQSSVKEDFDDVYAVTAIVSNAEKDIQKLKIFIRGVERDLCKKTYQKKIKRRSKNAVPIVISRVCKKFLLLRNFHEEPVLFYKDKCPDWLVVLADGYTAINESFFEIREEMKQLCHKFLKQKKDIAIINKERSMYLTKFKEEIVELEKEMEKENTAVGEKMAQLSAQVEERRQFLEEYVEKRNQLREMNENIKEEIEKVTDKYWAVDATMRYEYEFGKGFQSKMEERYRQAMCEEEFIQKLREDLEFALRNVEEFRYSKDLYMYNTSENIRRLQSTYDREVGKEKFIKEKIKNKIKEKENFINVKLNQFQEKDKQKEKMSELENELTGVEETINTTKEIVETELATMKVLREEYEEKYELVYMTECTLMLNASLRVKDLEEKNINILDLRKNHLNPLQVQIREYKERLHNASVDCEKYTAKSRVLAKRESNLEMESLDILHNQVKLSYVTNKSANNEDPEPMKLRDIFGLLDECEDRWNGNAAESTQAEEKLKDYQEYIRRLNNYIISLRAEIECYYCQVEPLKNQTKNIAMAYLSFAKLGSQRTPPGAKKSPLRREQMAPVPRSIQSSLPPPKVRKNARHKRGKVNSIIWKMDMASEAPPPNMTPANEQLFNNFGKFLFL